MQKKRETKKKKDKKKILETQPNYVITHILCLNKHEAIPIRISYILNTEILSVRVIKVTLPLFPPSTIVRNSWTNPASISILTKRPSTSNVVHKNNLIAAHLRSTARLSNPAASLFPAPEFHAPF